MKKFIRLTDKTKVTTIIVDAESIVAIRDLRTDKANTGENWQWSNVHLSSGACFDVKETEEEIIKKIYAI